MYASVAYLDYNATAPVRPGVGAAMAEALAMGGNPSSVHRFGRMARAAVDRARDSVAGWMRVDQAQITFTSGATEANALAVRTLAVLGAKALLVSAIEHDSVRASAAAAGLPVNEIPVTAAGVLDLAALQGMLAGPGPVGVAVMFANNETGVIQPVAKAAKLVHAAGGWLLCDAVQGAGRVTARGGLFGADLVTVSAHKLGGPQGVGALIAAPQIRVAPMVRGGGQESGLRGGTENVPGIAGFGAAVERERGERARVHALRSLFETRLRAMSPEVQVFGAGAARMSNTVCFALPGMAAEIAVIALDLAGVAVSSGSACSSGKVGHSHVLKAMGVPDALAACALRVSFGWASSRADVDRFVAAWMDLVVRARRAERAPLALAM